MQNFLSQDIAIGSFREKFLNFSRRLSHLVGKPRILINLHVELPNDFPLKNGTTTEKVQTRDIEEKKNKIIKAAKSNWRKSDAFGRVSFNKCFVDRRPKNFRYYIFCKIFRVH